MATLASDAPPRVPAPVESVTVSPGDTLSAIGARTSRTWEELAAYNHIPNPNLIYVGQVITIPPADYVPYAAPSPAPVASPTHYTPPVSETSHVASAPRVSYTAPAPSYSGSGIWGCIAAHESGGNPSTNTGNGYYGMYQDTQASWAEGGGLAYAPRADEATAAEQTAVNERIQAQQGWRAWPNTSRMCGA